ncbi:MAG: HlyD family secretion protein [Alphaproteobacteria bacterium]|nr:HlyD family secretion protein [Alphaproteobacteria bacterium]
MADQQDVSERTAGIAADSRPSVRADAPARPGETRPGEVRERTPDDRTPRQPDEPRRGDRPPQRRRFPWGRLLAAIIVIILIVGAVLYWWSVRDEESTDDAYTDGNAIVIAPHVTGYVVQLAVNDNEFVHKGQLLVKIDPRDFVAARDQAKGQLDLALAQLRNANIGHEIARTAFPARLESAQAQLASAKANQMKAQADYRRYHNLNPAATTREQIDAITAAAAQADAQVMQADAQVKEANLAPQNVAQTEQQVNQWQAQVEVAKAQLDQAELNLGYTDVVAPEDGWVTKRNVVQGNYVQAGTQIMALVSPQVWITANFKETQLTRMRPGQRVAIGVDAYPFLKLNGHVDGIQQGSGSRFTAFPAENATGNFVKVVQRVPVKIVIDSGLDPNLPLPLGISVEPTVHLK